MYNINTVLFGRDRTHPGRAAGTGSTERDIHVHVEEIELYRSTLKKKFAEKNVNWPSLSPYMYQVKPKLVK
jgi:hypothetical protein